VPAGAGIEPPYDSSQQLVCNDDGSTTVTVTIVNNSGLSADIGHAGWQLDPPNTNHSITFAPLPFNDGESSAAVFDVPAQSGTVLVTGSFSYDETQIDLEILFGLGCPEPTTTTSTTTPSSTTTTVAPRAAAAAAVTAASPTFTG